jgi:hypothetical protein
MTTKQKLILLLLLLLPSTTVLAQSTPDTVGCNYNASLPASVWQYSFVQITDIHIGEGAPGDDYGSAGYQDTISASDAGDPLLRLRNSVLWINQHKEELKINFVVVTGDLSESAELSEILRCKQLLDSLSVPYIPMIGNHDIWPLSQGVESPVPDGDSLFNAVFADAFTHAQAFFPEWNNGTRLTKVRDNENACWSYYQNYSFRYGSYHYIFTDFVSRAHDIAVFNGAAADAQLHDFAGGTWPWLQQTINAIPATGQDDILIFAHHPLSKSLLSGSFASFDFNEYDAITQFLLGRKESIGAWIAGHKHNVDEYEIKTWTFSPAIATGYEAAANWEYANGHFRIFRIYDTVAPQQAGIAVNTMQRPLLFPNPCSDQLSIRWNPDNHVNRLRILSSDGREVCSVDIPADYRTWKLDVSALPKGLYILELQGDRVINEKFLR